MTDEANFRSLLEKVDRWLAANRPEYHAALRPGATPEQLQQLEAQFNIALPAAFKLLYEWHDGQAEKCYDAFQHNRMLMCLEDIASSKEMLDGMIGYDFEDPEWWKTGWVPFLHNGGGDRLCVDVHTGDGERYGRVIEFWHDDDERDEAYASLDDWLQALVASMENGTYEVA